MISTLSKTVALSKEYFKMNYNTQMVLEDIQQMNVNSKILICKFLKGTIDEVKYLLPFEVRKPLSKRYNLHKIIHYANKYSA